MAPQLWQEVKEILGEALQREGEERTTYLAKACGDNPQLREKVETYLSFSGEKLDACADNLRDTLRDSVSPQRIGSRIGEIGRASCRERVLICDGGGVV